MSLEEFESMKREGLVTVVSLEEEPAPKKFYRSLDYSHDEPAMSRLYIARILFLRNFLFFIPERFSKRKLAVPEAELHKHRILLLRCNVYAKVEAIETNLKSSD